MHLYFHIPFCRQACHYCDFHFSTSLALKPSLVEAICDEITLQKDYLKHKNLQTIYFGGGTPSLLSEDDLNLIFNKIHQHFSLEKDVEITLEANPDDLNKNQLAIFKKIGINRLSIGIQTFDEAQLQFLNRVHTAYEAENSVKLAQDADFQNLSIDLIYGIPNTHSSHHILEQDIEKVLSFQVPHLSAYCLTIEEKTTFGRWLKSKKMQEIPDEFAAQQTEILYQNLEKAGYEVYEISNFAQNEAYSKHNTSYWKAEKYLGIGPSAHSFNHTLRQYNVSNNAQYIKAIQNHKIPATVEVLSLADQANDYLLTSLRTKWGCQIKHLEKLMPLPTDFHKNISHFIAQKWLFQEHETLFLTKEGRLFADRISATLFLE